MCMRILSSFFWVTNLDMRNFMVAQIVAEAVKSALGPQGMDKMLVDSLGDVTITSDPSLVIWSFSSKRRAFHKPLQHVLWLGFFSLV